ncbi:MAG: peptide chain release factor N(5)-glutamine methyltransferase [Erythrobacter sp.]|nr:peptide chain release factor N(5)-glutamine methyltransferase [Erythrobacter sp.]
MTTVGEAIRDGAVQLAATSDTARLDAELLMAHALGATRSAMLLKCTRDPAPPTFSDLIGRRAQHEPVAYITGSQEFYGRDFTVTRDTLIPRPDSETVVEAALELLGNEPSSASHGVLDLGTGTGALLLSVLAERPAFRGKGVDRSAAAVEVADQNAARLGLSDRATFSVGGWHGHEDEQGRAWWQGFDHYDLVISNPPYVELDAALDPSVRDYEPHSALFAGPDGLDDYRLIIPGLHEIALKAVLEIGASQADAVGELAEKAGFRAEVRRDLANRPRALILS